MRVRSGPIRVLAKGLVAVAIGAALSIGIAIGFAFWEQSAGGVCTRSPGLGRWSSVDVHPTNNVLAALVEVAAGAPYHSEERSKFGTSSIVLIAGVWKPIEMRLWMFGWPLRCLTYTDVGPAGYLRGTYSTVHTSNWINGVEASMPDGHRLVIPIRVRQWPIAGNIAVWGAISASLLYGKPFMKRWLRKRRGHCLNCGYDRAATSVRAPCPECGTAA